MLIRPYKERNQNPSRIFISLFNDDHNMICMYRIYHLIYKLGNKCPSEPKNIKKICKILRDGTMDIINKVPNTTK